MIDGLKPYPAYKDSGVPWLGEVPQHWRFERAKWLFRKKDRPVSDSDEVVTCFRDGVVTLRRLRRVRGFTESLKEIGYQGIRRGDLVIHAMDAFAGAAGVSDSDGKGTPVYSVCEPAEGVSAHYYGFLVREMARSQWILALAKGIRERSTDFRFEAFAEQRLPLPSFSEQCSILGFLDQGERRIRRYVRSKQKLIKLLQEQKKAIIHEAITRGIDHDVRCKASGVEWISELPEHWLITKLKFLASDIVDCLHATPRYEKDGLHPAIRTADVEPGRVKLESARRISRDDYLIWTSRLIPGAGDILYTREGERYGLAALVPEDVELCISQRMMIFRIRPPNISEFIMWQLNDEMVHAQASLDVFGAAAPHVNVDTIRNFVLAVPPPEEQLRIIEWIRRQCHFLDQAVERERAEILLLRELRTRLISDVVTGKLDVRNVELPADDPEDAESLDEIDTLDTDESIEDGNAEPDPEGEE